MGSGSKIAAPASPYAGRSLHVSTPIQPPSWEVLRGLRARGQRPAGGIWITDRVDQQRNLADSGAFAVGLPQLEDAYLVAGLGVTLIAAQSVSTIEVAHAVASSHPALFVIRWRHDETWRVVG